MFKPTNFPTGIVTGQGYQGKRLKEYYLTEFLSVFEN